MFDWKNLLFRCLEGGSHGMTGTKSFLKDVYKKTGQVIIQVRDVSGAQVVPG